MRAIQLRNQPAKWSAAEKEYLINNAGKLPAKVIAAKLGRSICSIQRKADFEGISLAPEKRRKSMKRPTQRVDPSILPGHDIFIVLMHKLRQLALNTTGRIELSLDNLKQAYEIVRKSEATLYRGCVR